MYRDYMQEVPVYFDNDKKQRLFGMRHIPNTKPPYPTIILYHGLTSTKSDDYRRFVRLSRQFCSEGYQVYRFDYRGHGDSALNLKDMIMDDLVKDSKDIFNYVKKHEDTDQENISIVSRSLCPGLYAKFTKKDVKAMVLHCPAAYPQKSIERGWGIGLKYGRQDIDDPYVLNNNFWKDLEKYNAITAIGYADIPILITAGDEDDVIWPDEVKELYNAANEPKKLVMIKYSGHDFIRAEHEKENHDETVNWIKKYMPAK